MVKKWRKESILICILSALMIFSQTVLNKLLIYFRLLNPITNILWVHKYAKNIYLHKDPVSFIIVYADGMKSLVNYKRWDVNFIYLFLLKYMWFWSIEVLVYDAWCKQVNKQGQNLSISYRSKGSFHVKSHTQKMNHIRLFSYLVHKVYRMCKIRQLAKTSQLQLNITFFVYHSFWGSH